MKEKQNERKRKTKKEKKKENRKTESWTGLSGKELQGDPQSWKTSDDLT